MLFADCFLFRCFSIALLIASFLLLCETRDAASYVEGLESDGINWFIPLRLACSSGQARTSD